MAISSDIKVILKLRDEATPQLKAATRVMTTAFTVLGAAAIAGGTLAVKSFIQTGKAIGNLAIKTGFSTEMLSKLSYAAERSGSNLGEVEAAVKGMARTMGDANDWTLKVASGLTKVGDEAPPAVQALQKIGLSAAGIMALSPENRFLAIGNALAAMPDPTLRASAAMEIFKLSGTDTLSMLSNMPALMKEASKYARIFSPEDIKAGQDMDAALTQLKVSVQKLGDALAPLIINVVKPFIEDLTRLVEATNAWIKANPQLTRTLTDLAVPLTVLALLANPLIFLSKILIGIAGAIGAIGVAGLATKAVVGTAAVAGAGAVGAAAVPAVGAAVGISAAAAAPLVALGIAAVGTSVYAAYKLMDAQNKEFIKSLAEGTIESEKLRREIERITELGSQANTEEKQWAENARKALDLRAIQASNQALQNALAAGNTEEYNKILASQVAMVKNSETLADMNAEWLKQSENYLSSLNATNAAENAKLNTLQLQTGVLGEQANILVDQINLWNRARFIIEHPELYRQAPIPVYGGRGIFAPGTTQAEALAILGKGFMGDISAVWARTGQIPGAPYGYTSPPGVTTLSQFGGVSESQYGNIFTRPAITTIAELGKPEGVFPLDRLKEFLPESEKITDLTIPISIDGEVITNVLLRIAGERVTQRQRMN